MNYSREVQEMCCVAKGPNHGPAPIPEEGKWVKAYEIKDISAFTHGVGWRSFLNMLAYKADLYGKEFLTIDPKYTTWQYYGPKWL